ncbi:MAG: ATP synthase subunit I [Tatlockia sp.]|nr:ATP synthase subunit I [Tatlockia sp.]
MGEKVKAKSDVVGVKRLLKTQLITSLLISLAFFIFSGKREGISALLGGLVAVLPSMLFANKLFRYHGARAAQQIVKSFYVGEALKILSTAILFSLVFIFYKVAPLAFFFTYIVVLMNFWFAPLIFANKQNRPESD